MQDLIDALGIETVMNELEQWMSSDQLEEFIEDVKSLYDLDIIE